MMRLVLILLVGVLGLTACDSNPKAPSGAAPEAEQFYSCGFPWARSPVLARRSCGSLGQSIPCTARRTTPFPAHRFGTAFETEKQRTNARPHLRTDH